MNTKRNFFTLFALLMLVLSACMPMVVPASAAAMPEEAKMLEFDISEDITRFIFNRTYAVRWERRHLAGCRQGCRGYPLGAQFA